jgi:hypothetical protein
MEYEKEVTVPANTPENDPVKDEIQLDKGILSGKVYFPLGCVHLVQARLFHGEFQIAPMNRDQWLKGEGAEVPFADNYDMTDEPFLLKIRACSPGTTYEHKIKVHASVIPEWLARPEQVLSRQLAVLRGILEQVVAAVAELINRISRAFGV